MKQERLDPKKSRQPQQKYRPGNEQQQDDESLPDQRQRPMEAREEEDENRYGQDPQGRPEGQPSQHGKGSQPRH